MDTKREAKGGAFFILNSEFWILGAHPLLWSAPSHLVGYFVIDFVASFVGYFVGSGRVSGWFERAD